MSRAVRELFEEMLAGEPPMELTVEAVVAAGDREVQGRRRRVGLSLAAALLVVVGLAVVVANVASGGSEGGVSVTAPPANDPEGGVGPPVSGVDPEVSTTPSTGDDPGLTTTSASTSTTVSTAVPTAPVTGEELLPDPGFEADSLGWSTFGPATVLTPVAEARSGAHALEITTTSDTALVAGATNRPVLVSTVAGRRYRASCWVRSAGQIEASVQLQEYTTEWQRAGDPAPSPETVLTDPGRWYQLSVTYTAQQSGHQLPLSVFSPDLDPGGASLLVDDCTLTLG